MWMLTLVLLLPCVLFQSCQSPEVIALNRRYLQDPLFDTQKTNNLSNAMIGLPYKANEVGASASEISASGTCPTCGK